MLDAGTNPTKAERAIRQIVPRALLRRRAAGETLASIAKSYAVDVSMISRLAE
jgi:hypothetical protein